MHFLQRELIQRGNAEPLAISRRDILRLVMQGSGAWVLGCGFVAPSAAATADPVADVKNNLQFNAFLKITPDNVVTVVIKHLDKGQGVTTGLATLVAEELDAAWEQVQWEFAPADSTRYNNLFWGPAQGTGGSTSIANSWTQMRTAGATARAMFVAAAAKKWQAPADKIMIADGIVTYTDTAGKRYRATLGELVGDAVKVPVPESPQLKAPQDYRLIGKTVPRKDSLSKTTGTAVYTQDIKMPGMLTAMVLYPPKLFGKLKSVDSSKAKAVPGVVEIIEIPRGVAVLAEGYWQAQKARGLLRTEWDLSACETRSSEVLFKEYSATAQQDGTLVKKLGDAPAVLQKSPKVIDAEYQLQYLAHATMEPMNCVVHFTGKECDLWFGSQMPTNDQHETAAALGLPPEKVRVHTLFAGGSFGRRAAPGDYVMDAVAIAKQLPGRPIKMMWSREDDMHNGKFRPMAVHRVRAALDNKGKPAAWQHHAVAQPILRGSPFEAFIQGPIDGTVVEGIEDTAYAIPNLSVHGTEIKAAVSTLWWRSVGHSGNAFVMETFIDRLAREAKADPLQFRRELLAGQPRYLGALNLAAEKAGWNKPLAKNSGRGIAVHKAMGSWVAQVAEVTVKEDGSYKVERVVCAIDCGLAVNPDIVAAQMEGSIGFALGQVLDEEITLKDGAVVQSNFNDYSILRLADMPKVEVYIVPSAEAPSGVGEPGVPPLAPAVANALTNATGKFFTRLPIGRKV